MIVLFEVVVNCFEVFVGFLWFPFVFQMVFDVSKCFLTFSLVFHHHIFV